MIIAVLQVEIAVDGSTSLKDKRRVVRSLKDRLHREHQVSVAEVAKQDDIRRGVLGVVMAGTDAAYAQGALDRIVDQLRATPGFVLTNHRTEILHGN